MENKTCLKPPSPAMVDASFLPWLSGIGSLNGVKHSRCCDGICAVVRTLRLCEWMQWLIRCEDECHVNVPDFSATLCGQKKYDNV